MSNTNVSNNDVNKTGVYNEGLSPGRCAVVITHRPSRRQATIRKKQSAQDNICVMTCYYHNQPGVRGYRQIACLLERKRVVSSRRAEVV